MANADSMEALRLTVCEFTTALREEGTTPEGVLISLKTLISDRAFPVVPDYSSTWTGYQLRELISTWSIKEFFREETAAKLPPGEQSGPFEPPFPRTNNAIRKTV